MSLLKKRIADIESHLQMSTKKEKFLGDIKRRRIEQSDKKDDGELDELNAYNP